MLLENGLRFKNKFSEFDATSMEIIRMLLSYEDVSSNKILSIKEEQQYNIAHYERLKVQKLKEINFKIKTLLGINGDVIHSGKLNKDRRIRVYSIQKNYFFNKIT